jgi:hypothetical protein
MGAPLKICRNRTVCAVLASGVVISLTALTGGVAPAFAAPGSPGSPGAPSTTVEPEPPAATRAPAEKSSPAEVPSVAPSSVEKAPAAAVPTTDAPVVVAPSAPSSVEAPPSTRTPEPVAPTTRDSAVTSAPAAPSSTAASSAPVPAPRDAPTPSPAVTSATKSPTTESSASPSPASPSSVTPSSAAPPSPEAVTPTSGERDRPASSSPASSSPSPESSPASSEAAPSSSQSAASEPSDSPTASTASTASTTSSRSGGAPRALEKIAPQTLQAPEEDVQIAKTAAVVEAKPVEAPKQDIADVSRMIDLTDRDRDPFNRDQGNRDPGNRDQGNRDPGNRNDDQVRLAGGWDRNVRQWRPDWVDYDDYYRPVLSNPYRDPVRIVYVYQNAQRVVWIPPLARIVLDVAQYAAYSFTAVVTNAVNQAVNVAVGSFFGGGYYPGVGLPPPPPPPSLINYANVPVQVRYPDATYQPFRVNKIIDVGPDAQYGEQKVLLDGVTPAWGEWKQTPSGERSFEVHKTQQFPGLDDPQPGPLPGDYQLTLASDASPSGMNTRDVYMIAVAVACGALSIGAVILAVVMGRRRRSLR